MSAEPAGAQPVGPGDRLVVQAPVRVDRRTKDLVKRLQPGEIAVIDHADLDRVAAEGLVEAAAVAVRQRRAVDHRPLPERRARCWWSQPERLLVDDVGDRCSSTILNDGDVVTVGRQRGAGAAASWSPRARARS